jgi:hypothetical protein
MRKTPILFVDGEIDLNAMQRGEIDGHYRRFRLAVDASPAFYHKHKVILKDGTEVIFQSIGDHDRVYAKPVGGNVTPIALAGYVLLPRDAANSSGWNRSGVDDSARAYLAANASKPIVTLPKAQLHVKMQAGAVDWRGDKGVILTYDHNGNNRYATDRWGIVFPSGSDPDASSKGVYYKGTKIDTPVGVQAAAIFSGYLVIIGHTTVYACPSPLSKIDAALARGSFTKLVSPTWTGITVAGSVSAAKRASAWHFKNDGSVAAAAYAYTAFGPGTWTMRRMRTEALTMCKRYLTFAIVDGALTATVSDTAFTCDPIAVYSGATISDLSTANGTLSFTGKRLWGVDWDSSGAEIVVTFERTGSGSYSASSHLDSVAWTQHWGVYANGNEIVKATSVLPALAFNYSASFGFLVDVSQTGGGHLSNEYLALHALDARTKFAIVERLTMAYSGSVSDTSGASSVVADGSGGFVTVLHADGYADAAYGVTAAIEVIESGAVITTAAETLTEFFPSCYADLRLIDPRYGVPFAMDDFLVNGSGGDFSRLYVPTYPQCGAGEGENIYEQLFLDSTMLGREAQSFFNCYPNQVSDMLGKFMFGYSQQITTFAFGYRWSVSGDPYIGYPLTISAGTIDSSFQQIGQTSGSYALPKASAIPSWTPLHFIAGTRDLFVHEYRDLMKRLQQHNHSLTQTGVAPSYFTNIYTRDVVSDPWAITDLLSPISDSVVIDGNTVDSATFHIDPVRIL